MSTYIKADQFYYPHGVRRGGYLELVDGKFGKHVESLPEGADVLDYSGYSIAPGLVDTHIHGFGGVDVMDNNIEGTLHTTVSYTHLDVYKRQGHLPCRSTVLAYSLQSLGNRAIIT